MRAAGCAAAVALCTLADAPAAAGGPVPLVFHHVVIDSTPPENPHCKAVGDIDGDGYVDVVAAGAGTSSQGLFWYAYPAWSQHTIVPADSAVPFTTDVQTCDVDNDGDLDVVIPQGYPNGFSVVWYENPSPGGDPALSPWIEHAIGTGAAHDLEVGDVNGDGRVDVVVRQDSTTLFLQDGLGGWKTTVINRRPLEGTALGDVDRDGDLDVCINGYWLENPMPLGDPVLAPWTEHAVDPSVPAQVGVTIADVDSDGRPDVLYAPSESANGKLSWYAGPPDPKAGPWPEHVIDGDISYVHTFKTADMDGDGDADVVTAEMEQSSDPDVVGVYRNDGSGLVWSREIVATTGSHNIRVADIGGDGDLDIVGANWSGLSPLEMWENQLDPKLGLDGWKRHVVDTDKPWRSVLVTTDDIDRDGYADIVTGGWWYRNPGSAGGAWARDSLGTEVRNMGAVYDFDRDGDSDVLATRGLGSQANDSLVWARNDGAGVFTVVDNAGVADGDFLQGVAVAPFAGDGRPQVFLSWHQNPSTVQRLDLPEDPSTGVWAWDVVTSASQREELSAGDIDRDGDIDVLQGTQWLRNDGASWTPLTLSGTVKEPDRNRLADVNRDGRLDAVVGFVAISVPGLLAWYEQGTVAAQLWTEHVISTSVVGPMSVDAADMDGDGDIDVVVGEHNLASPSSAGLFVFENFDGQGIVWVPHTVYVGDEHHDGARVVDIDNDGDLDIVSIGWSHNRVVLYENTALDNAAANTAPVAAFSAVPASGEAPLLVNFDAASSFDADGDSLTFAWDFGDSTGGTGTAVAHTYQQGGAYEVRLTVSDGELGGLAGTTILVGSVQGVTGGLVHQWRFDDGEGSTAADFAGGSDGTLVGPPAWDFADARSGGALDFDGAGDRVDIGTFDVAMDSGLTLSCWFKAGGFGVPDARLVSKATGVQTNDHYWMLSTISSTGLRFRLKAGGSTATLATGPGELEAGRWYHVAATYDGASMKIYKDGVEVASAPKTGPIDTSSVVPAAIGDQPMGDSKPFDGLIDDVRIYDRALTPGDIDSLLVYSVDVTVSGGGSVVRSPSRAYYLRGDTVVVTATPDPGWAFSGWAAGLPGAQNPDTIVVGADTAVAATFTADVTSGVRPPPLTEFTLRQNYPNPFSDRTSIEFGLPKRSDVTLEIFDVAGRRVFRRWLAEAPSGWNRLEFSGRGRTGALPAGVYFYRVTSDAGHLTRKMVILR